MEWKKRVLAIGAVTVTGLAMATATANANTASGSCDKSKHVGQGWTQYTEGGVYTKVTRFDYKISGAGTGGKSNANIRHYENRRLGDRQLYANNSPDNVKQNENYSHTPDNPIQLDSNKKQHSTYTFIFDTAGGDPECKATTSDFPA